MTVDSVEKPEPEKAPLADFGAEVLVTCPGPGVVDARSHRSRYVATRLSVEQGLVLKSLVVGFQERHVRLRNGRHVEDGAGVIRWLLESVGVESGIIQDSGEG
jgi:predicted amidohydrolase